ncbi:DUF1028 domain-containing protein [Limobrevibacterium gyesilva]|uniref:DUF1028 domain-containing protein n=1 Tax=Limobrevibacterium gyesilva TaxID=2991712 RepID=A0AA42CF61_9PROT|nr:DUF1028 domain-containing protein [Limobrevibacterium gyesilva]MCW3476853.1 DUF1028 domain-containing protein [Limobrevibacterium gyesilva]
MTYSLLGRCARTGQLGAVVTTSAMGVGARCPFARAGVGAALTQHRTDPRLGPLLIALLARGFTAQQALDGAVAATPHRDWRQLAVIDAAGRTASFTGAHVRAERGEAHGPDCVAIANIVRSAELPAAMARAFAADPALPLAARLVQAIQAGEAAGGEFAAVRSAALLVVDRESFPYVDLRVDDHATPLAELARLWAAYARDADDYVIRAIDPDQAATYVPPPPKP